MIFTIHLFKFKYKNGYNKLYSLRYMFKYIQLSSFFEGTFVYCFYSF